MGDPKLSDRPANALRARPPLAKPGPGIPDPLIA
jgi:hypothetical protein